MRWDQLPSSDNIEDRRGDGDSGGSGGFGMGYGAGGLGIGAVVVLGLVGYVLGIDPRLLIGGAEVLTRHDMPYQPARHAPARKGTPTDEIGKFVSNVLGSTDVVWKDVFTKVGRTYQRPTLVMFNGRTSSACGLAQSAMGPFYCPGDKKIYLDTSFFRDLEKRFQGCDAGSKACQFSQAYVIAHEVGHHVQNLLEILPKVQRQQHAVGKVDANHLQVQVELQADCLAGVWANKSQEKWNLIQPGDVESALKTASAIGDDRLQKRSQGQVVPDAFTHGTSEQRMRWFNNGLKGGTVEGCNTFASARL